MTKYDPDRHHRCSIRLPRYDYARAGAYFVTICTHGREPLFGDVVDGRMVLNSAGRIVEDAWNDLAKHYPQGTVDAFVVMPDHVHGIIIIASERLGAQHPAPLQRDGTGRPNVAPGSLGAMVRSIKSAVTKRINEMRGTPGARVWQRNYYEHIVRNHGALNRIRAYIANNPVRWESDRKRAQHAAPQRAGGPADRRTSRVRRTDQG